MIAASTISPTANKEERVEKRGDKAGETEKRGVLRSINPYNRQTGTLAYAEELFGPVASVMVVPDENTAITVANDTKYGLGASVYTIDQERGRRIADQIDAGMLYINHPVWIYEDMPFGGIKKSGYGRECGPLGIEEFLNKKLFREM